MEIKNIELKTLRENCVDLISKAYLELGQKPSKDDIVSFALILAEDLKLDFQNMTFESIRQSFRQGIRNTDKFHLTVKTYYYWIKTHRQLIWNESSKEPKQRDKRLNYRNTKGKLEHISKKLNFKNN